MPWTQTELDAFLAKRRRRNIVIGLVLGALAFLFFAITVGRMTA